MFTALALVCAVATQSAAPGSTTPVAESAPWRFYSAFWPNLHHILYASAWTVRAARNPDAFVLSGRMPQPLQSADLTADERRAWDDAVAYYDRDLASRDLLFDEQMGDIRQRLIAAGDEMPPGGLPRELTRVLEQAAPVYRKHWWAAHDRANRAWIAAAVDHVAGLVPAVSARLSSLYQTPWFTTPIRVDVVWVANRQGAYTLGAPAPAHSTVSSTDANDAGWASAEILFHESSHALIDRLQQRIAAELARAGKRGRDLWHVALFYIVGEVTRETLAARGVSYTPYLYATGLFDRAWPQYRSASEGVLKAYVDGTLSLDEAVKKLVEAI